MGILEKTSPVDKTVLQRMQKTLHHRGPDDTGLQTFKMPYAHYGLYNYGGVAFDRLSIRDLSQAGHQPMESDDEKVILAMNGEIYNSEELRPLLIEQGVTFRGTSDSEVLLQLYLHYGIEEALQMVDGAFALCIVDQTKQKIYLSRDRMGEKPIYYYRKDNFFLFASEYKAFYCYPEFKAELNQNAVSEYFIFRYPAGEMTFLEDVYLIKPGTYLEISQDSITEHTYWTLPAPKSNGLSFKKNKQRLKKLISKSVARRLISDRPIGIQLSGGVDSSYVAAIMREQSNVEIKSYSITVDDEAINEEKYIDVVNQQMHFVPHKLKLDASVFLDNWEKATWFYEAPLQHQGNVPLLQLDNEATKEVAVLMCGDGADECMGGYARFPRIMSYRDKKCTWRGVQIKNILKGKCHYGSLDEHFISLSQFLTDDQVKALRPKTYKQDIRNAYRHRKQIINACHNTPSIHRYLQYEMVTYMLDTLLRGDKMSMASSLEMRAPLLMTELVEFLQTVPGKYLVDGSKSFMHDTKILLKSLCADVYGESFAYRYKVGLGVPMLQIFSDNKVRAFINKSVLPGIKRRGIVDYNYVSHIFDSLQVIPNSLDSRLELLWLAFSFELWAQMYIDKSPLI